MATRINTLPFPYYVLVEGQPQESLPRNGTHFILGRNGVFIHKGTIDPADESNGLVESVTRVLTFPESFKWTSGSLGTWTNGEWVREELEPEPEKILPGLETVQEYACIKINPIPHEIARLALSFFGRVYREHHAESEVQLYYCVRTGAFELVCPTQTVSHGGVAYVREGADLEIPGKGTYRRVGTIHSHCDFGAFHSGTDTADEEYEDGLHVTFGHVNQNPFSVVSSVVANGRRFQQDPSTVIQGIAPSGTKSAIATGWHSGTESFEQFFEMLPLEDSLKEAAILEKVLDWFPRVSKQTWNPLGGFSVRRKRKGRYSQFF